MLTFSRYFAALFSLVLIFVSVLTNANNIGQDVAVNVQNSLDSPISEALTNIDNGVALTDSSSDISFSGSSASSSVLRFLVMGDWGTFTSTNKRKLDDVEMLADNNQNQNQNNNQNKNNNQNQNNNNNQNKNNNNNQNNGGTYWSVLVAAAMANYASANPVSFLIALGDNFYDTGVTSTTDSLWTSVYTNVYSADSLQVPWYAIFGNHDYGSNKGAGSLQAQIDYGEYHMDDKWSAGHCYMKSFTIPDSSATLEVVFIDTTLIAPQETYITSTSNGVTQDVQDYLQQEQLDCMEGYLAASTASFLLVAGHYPIYSTGKNSPGDMDTMVDAVYPYLEKYNVDAYLCGHDHLLQHLAYTTSSGTSMDFIVSGAAGKPDNQLTSGITSAATMKFAAATGGFAAVTATTSQMTVDLIDYTGTTLYSVTRSQQRSTAAYGSVSDGSSTDGSSDVSNNTPVEETVVDTKEEEKTVDAVSKEDKTEDAKKAEQETYVGTFNSMNVDIRRVVEVGVLGVTFIAIVALLAVAKSVFGGKPAGDDMVLDVRQDVEAGAVRPGVVTKKMIRMTHNNAKGGVRPSSVLTPGALQSKAHASPPAVPHTPAPSTAATATAASSTTTTPGVHSTVVNPGKRWFPTANNVSPVVAANQHRSMNTSRRGLTNHPLLQHRNLHNTMNVAVGARKTSGLPGMGNSALSGL